MLKTERPSAENQSENQLDIAEMQVEGRVGGMEEMCSQDGVSH